MIKHVVDIVFGVATSIGGLALGAGINVPYLLFVFLGAWATGSALARLLNHRTTV